MTSASLRRLIARCAGLGPWLAAIGIVATPGCHDSSGGGAGGSTASTASASVPQAASAPQATSDPHPTVQSNPLAAYTKETVSRYDAKRACLATCAAGLRCRTPALFSAGSAAVGARLKTCRAACTEAVEAPGYVEKARACLSSGTCDKFNSCAGQVIKAEP